MACFIAPLVQAVAVTALRKSQSAAIRNPEASPFLHYLPDLEKMLWGGSLMLIVDHIINGELTWRFPFFTALELDGGWQVMLREMLTVGVPMCLVITAFWGLWVAFKSKKSAKTA